MHYLYGTRDRGLHLRPGDRASASTFIKLRAYADCGNANHVDGRSQYCVCFDIVPQTECEDELNPLQRWWKNGMFYYRSWLAPTVDLSSTEGECGVVVEALCNYK